MKKQNNSLESSSFFYRVKSWIYKLFHRTSGMKNTNVEDVKTRTYEQNNLKNSEKNNEPFEEYKLKNERREYLLNLQRKYKSKEILEQDISQQDKNDLENLYIEQNNELKRKIRSYDLKISKLNG